MSEKYAVQIFRRKGWKTKTGEVEAGTSTCAVTFTEKTFGLIEANHSHTVLSRCRLFKVHGRKPLQSLWKKHRRDGLWRLRKAGIERVAG